MSTYSITTLLRLWKQNELTAEQAVGHTLQHLLTLTEKMTAIEKRQPIGSRAARQPATQASLV